MSDAATNKPVIGILGGIGAGKTLVAAEFETLGCRRVDADAIGHEVLDEPAVQAAVRRRWGDGVFDDAGSVDRSALADVVFDDPAAISELNAMTHPQIVERIEGEIAAAQGDASCPAVVLDAALMVEAGLDGVCTHRVFVHAPSDQRAQRVCRTRRWSREAWEKREESQIPLDTKSELCDYTIENGSTVSFLQQQVRELYKTIIHATRPS